MVIDVLREAAEIVLDNDDGRMTAQLVEDLEQFQGRYSKVSYSLSPHDLILSHVVPLRSLSVRCL